MQNYAIYTADGHLQSLLHTRSSQTNKEHLMALPPIKYFCWCPVGRSDKQASATIQLVLFLIFVLVVNQFDLKLAQKKESATLAE